VCLFQAIEGGKGIFWDLEVGDKKNLHLAKKGFVKDVQTLSRLEKDHANDTYYQKVSIL